MNMIATTDPALAPDPAMLTQVVQAALGRSIDSLEEWRMLPAGESRGAATAGIYRVAGMARVGGRRLPWAVVLKVIRPAAAEFNPAVREVGHPLYWRREALAYESGLLATLPGGIAAPRCFGVEERTDEACWLWLEELTDRYGRRWPLSQYARAAAALGRLNGAYLVDHAIPDYPWLGPPGALRGLLDAFLPVTEVIADPAIWQHPLLRAAFPVPVAERILRMWETREVLLAALDQTPLVLCHKDAFQRNMFAVSSAAGSRELVMIDWAYMGRGEVGLDAADLFAASYSLFGVESGDLQDFDATIFDSYLAGLREAGWTGAAQVVRLSFAASAALKYGGLLLWLADVADERRHSAWAALAGQSFEAFVQQQARLVTYLLKLADEAFALVRRL